MTGGFVLPREHIQYGYRFLVTVQAAAVFLHRDLRTVHLAGTGLTAQLGNQFVNLCKPGGGNGMATGFETTGRVNRHTAADGEITPLRRGPRLLSPRSPPDAVREVVDIMGSVRPDGYGQAARMLSTGDVKADVEALSDTLRLQILYGEDDVITPPARNLEVAALRPSAPVIVVPAAGHALCIEQPAALNAAVAQFLAC